jgi:tripartite-type tricarboxylate transporter receptor subunit TctC
MNRFVTAVLLAAIAAGAHAQVYPTKPIHFVVPYVAGGAGDIFARVIGQKLFEALGQAVIIDNRPGANGIIGTDLVAKAPPDGYSIVMGNNAPFVLNPSLYSKLPYDPGKDFAPVTQGTYYAYVLVLNPSMPAKTIQELITLARAKPGQITYGSGGNGSAAHLAGVFLAKMTGTQLTHVAYKGNAQSLANVLGGDVSMMFDTLITSIPQLKMGKLRVLGYSGDRRAPQLPDVPTIDELGLKGFDISSWQGILAPAGTPKSIVDRLYQETAKALKMPDVIDHLATQGGNELVGSRPEQFAALIRAEIVKYEKVIKEAGIRIE